MAKKPDPGAPAPQAPLKLNDPVWLDPAKTDPSWSEFFGVEGKLGAAEPTYKRAGKVSKAGATSYDIELGTAPDDTHVKVHFIIDGMHRTLTWSRADLLRQPPPNRKRPVSDGPFAHLDA